MNISIFKLKCFENTVKCSTYNVIVPNVELVYNDKYCSTFVCETK